MKKEAEREKEGKKEGKSLKLPAGKLHVVRTMKVSIRETLKNAAAPRTEATLISYSRWLRYTGVITCLPIATLS